MQENGDGLSASRQLNMNANEKKIAYQSIQRIHHLWFDWKDEDAPIDKITALFEVLSIIAPYECSDHVHYLWLAYRSAKTECLWRLAQYRLDLFSAGLTQLKNLADTMPVFVRE